MHGDDLLAGQTARNFVEFGWPGPTMWHHPRLRDLLVHWSTGALGAGAWGLKVWSVLLGTLCVPATGCLVRIVGRNRTGAILAAAIVATDPLHVDFSRQAINDVYVSFFPVAAILALLAYAKHRRPWQIVVAGAPPGARDGLEVERRVPGRRGRRADDPRRGRGGGLAAGEGRGDSRSTSPRWSCFPPPCTCSRSGRGSAGATTSSSSSASRAPWGRRPSRPPAIAGTMVAGYQGYLIGAWRWFLQPVWWVDAAPAAGGGGGVLFLPGVGNPVTWLATLPAAGWAAWRWFHSRDRAAGTLLVLWLAAYLPFVLVRRPIWVNAAVIVVPFWAALVGLAAARLWERARILVAAWAAVAVVAAMLLWVPVTGRRFEPSDAVVRALVPPLALDPSSHPATSFFGVDVAP